MPGGVQREADSVHLELARQNRLYAMLSRVNRTLLRARDPHELYDAACRIAVEEGGFDCAWVGLVEPVGGRVAPVARAGAPMDLARAPLSLAEEPADADPIGAPLRQGHPFIVNDAAGHCALPAAWRQAMGDVSLRGLAAFPLRVEGEVTGVLAVGVAAPGGFPAAVIRLLAEVAADVSFALEVMRGEEKRLAAESKIRYLAYYDAQTGLPSRMLFGERLEAACSAAGGRDVAVLVIGLRQYHAALQVLGDRAGLELMRIVAGRLEASLPTSAIGRITESEFAVILEGAAGLHQVEETAWRIHGALAEAVPAEGRDVFLAPFIGIAVHPHDGSPAGVLKAAAMAAAKGPQDGSSCCRFFVADMDRASREQLEMDSALRLALERREFVLHYQPQVDLASGRVIGAEALVRWQRPGHGLVPPGGFIPLLEETGLIVPVGKWVVQEACRFARQCQADGLPPFRVAVNLSARQFQESDVGALVRQALAESGLEARWLEVEVTESVVLLNAEAAIFTMNELKSLGVSHALDDFGTGYSSLSYLQRLPVARIKVDRSFVAHVTSDPRDAAIVRAIVAMAHSLGMAVVAEGVETEGQLGFLRGLQCESMQGYYFSPPVPAAEFIALLRDDRHIPPLQEEAKPACYVLVVDDEPNVLSALRRLLRQSGLRLLTTTSTQEAFNLLATHPVGVVVSDQRMPEMTGTEFLRRVKELHPAAVRIILSGYTDLNSVIDAVNRGAIFKFLTKPWDDDALVACLRDALRLYEMEQENRELAQRLEDVLSARPAGERSL